jgi:hypothetical protein
MAYPKASNESGNLTFIPMQYCHLYIPNEDGKSMSILFQALPSVTDSKGAKYDPTPVIGRATPLLTYANSDQRTISADLPFFVTKTNIGNVDPYSNEYDAIIGTVDYNLAALRAITSAVYPRKGVKGVTYRPPPVCKFKCGSFLSNGYRLCVIIDKYSVKNDPGVPSDPVTLCPYKFTVNVSMIKVYSSDDLPSQGMIWKDGA